MDFYSSLQPALFLGMYSSIGVFLQVFVKTIIFEANSHGLFKFSKKGSASRHALKTKFILIAPCFSRRPNFQTKRLCWNNIIEKFYVYGL